MRSGTRTGSASAFAAAYVSRAHRSVAPVRDGDRRRERGRLRRRFVPVEELRRGDRCVGRTVFVGTEIEEFELEILGVVRGATPGTDLIIARAEGALLEGTGILEGMSGSPVYKDGRLVGAVASTWQFSREPIAGITPIAEMLSALERMDSDDALEPVRSGADGFPGLAMLPDGERATSSLARVVDEAGVLPLRADVTRRSGPGRLRRPRRWSRSRRRWSCRAPRRTSSRRVSDVLGSGVTPAGRVVRPGSSADAPRPAPAGRSASGSSGRRPAQAGRGGPRARLRGGQSSSSEATSTGPR